jgi:uncharacterized Zn finger protein
MNAPVITLKQALAGANKKVIDRAKDYATGDAVFSRRREDKRLHAHVDGHSEPFYRVRVDLGPHGVNHAICNCPYDGGGHCKHIVAVLLCYLEDPGSFEAIEALKPMINKLPAAELRGLLMDLIDQDLDVEARVRRTLELSISKRKPKPKPKPVDRKSVTRELEVRLRGVVPGGWNDGDIDLRLCPMLDEIASFAEDQPEQALAKLLFMAEFLTQEYEAYETETELGEFIEHDLGDAIEATLARVDLPEDERTAIEERLRKMDRAFEKDYYLTPFARITGSSG